MPTSYGIIKLGLSNLDFRPSKGTWFASSGHVIIFAKLNKRTRSNNSCETLCVETRAFVERLFKHSLGSAFN